MIQSKSKTLDISFASVDGAGDPADLAIYTVVDIVDNLTVKAVNSEGSIGIVGTVKACVEDSNRVTVSTRFREHRDDRESAGCVLGPYTYGATGLVESYTGVIPATAAGTADEPFAPTTGVDDALKIKIGTGSSQNFTLAETDTTAVLVCAKINATATDFTAVVVGTKVSLVCDNLNDNLEVETVANDAYTELGLTVGVNSPTAASADAGSIAGLVIKLPNVCGVTGTVPGPYAIVDNTNDAMKIKIGSGTSQTFDLTTDAAATPQDICDDINATATDFTAVVVPGYKVKLLADEPWNDIEIEAISNDAYATLGFVVGVISAPTIIETLEK